jgi:hypothetical protein
VWCVVMQDQAEGRLLKTERGGLARSDLPARFTSPQPSSPACSPRKRRDATGCVCQLFVSDTAGEDGPRSLYLLSRWFHAVVSLTGAYCSPAHSLLGPRHGALGLSCCLISRPQLPHAPPCGSLPRKPDAVARPCTHYNLPQGRRPQRSRCAWRPLASSTCRRRSRRRRCITRCPMRASPRRR